MEYFIIFICELLGIGFQILDVVRTYDKQFPAYTKKQIFGVFWEEDWTTLLGSALVLVFNFVAHYVVDTNFPDVHNWSLWGIPYIVLAYIMAMVLGFAGQFIVNKWLGTAKQVLIKKSEEIEAKLK